MLQEKFYCDVLSFEIFSFFQKFSYVILNTKKPNTGHR